MAIKFTIFVGYDNVREIILVDDFAVLNDLSAITKVTLIIGSIEIDSDTAPANTIWWTDTKTITQDMVDADTTGLLEDELGNTIDILSLRLGNVSELVAVAGKHKNCCLIVTNADTPANGSIWHSKMTITVKVGCAV